jgi:membrane-bound ClpP family serine protease
MRAAKLQEHHGRVLQLVSGVLMLSLAGAMLLAPELLESITGTVVVFGVAAVICGLVVALDPRRTAARPAH